MGQNVRGRSTCLHMVLQVPTQWMVIDFTRFGLNLHSPILKCIAEFPLRACLDMGAPGTKNVGT